MRSLILLVLAVWLASGFYIVDASQRAIVDAEASQTPRSITSRCSSAREKRDNGRSCSRGS